MPETQAPYAVGAGPLPSWSYGDAVVRARPGNPMLQTMITFGITLGLGLLPLLWRRKKRKEPEPTDSYEGEG